MDCLWTPWTLKDLYQLLKRIHGVHGPSMDSMDYRRIVQTLEKLYFSVPQAILVESMEYMESKD